MFRCIGPRGRRVIMQVTLEKGDLIPVKIMYPNTNLGDVKFYRSNGLNGFVGIRLFDQWPPPGVFARSIYNR
jgi:hypothetical protein